MRGDLPGGRFYIMTRAPSASKPVTDFSLLSRLMRLRAPMPGWLRARHHGTGDWLRQIP